jgi:tRNA modification GTPase
MAAGRGGRDPRCSGVPRGLRPAEAGEFTRRAFMNGRLDLVAVEGLADLIAAETEVQRRLAQFHSGGGASAVFEAWRGEMIQVLARLEAAIDFVDEEGVADAGLSEALPRLAVLRDEMRAKLDDRHQGERVREGVRIVLAGPPNVGKSSLLNRLAQREAAIVSATPGTTRDVIEVHLDLAGVPSLSPTPPDCARARPTRSRRSAWQGPAPPWPGPISWCG